MWDKRENLVLEDQLDQLEKLENKGNLELQEPTDVQARTDVLDPKVMK